MRPSARTEPGAGWAPAVLMLRRPYDLGLPPMRRCGVRAADWPAVPGSARCCRGAVTQVPSDSSQRTRSIGAMTAGHRGRALQPVGLGVLRHRHRARRWFRLDQDSRRLDRCTDGGNPRAPCAARLRPDRAAEDHASAAHGDADSGRRRRSATPRFDASPVLGQPHPGPRIGQWGDGYRE